MNPVELIKNEARRIGFDLVGVTSARPHPDFAIYEKWLNQDFQGEMHYLERHAEKKSDPQKILPGVKSIISCGLICYWGHPRSINYTKENNGWVSLYAWGDDYHEIIQQKLSELENFIKNHFPESDSKSYVDTGPILERSYAQSAGLGWIGKNTCVINSKLGSYFFLAEILTTLDLEADSPATDHCGKCTRCIDACPTIALKPYELEATKCISYLTIEHKGEISDDLQKKMGNHLVGCDICQDVCPYNRKPGMSNEAAFDPRPGFFAPKLTEWENLTQDEFSKKFKNSPIKRLKLEGLKRNVGIAKKNREVS